MGSPLGLVRASLLGLLAITSVGCGKIEVPLNLALAGDSTIELRIPFFPPPYDLASTRLVGGVETTLEVDLNPFELISPDGLVAAIVVDDILIAGENLLIAGSLPTGTVCVEPDPAAESGGFAFIQPFRHQIDFQLTLNSQVRPTGPLIVSLLGADASFPFAAEVDTVIPVTLADVFDLLLGVLLGGGGGPGLEITQEIHATLPADTPLLGASEITANLTLVTVDEIPADPLLADCATP